MNRGTYPNFGEISSGAYLRRGRLPRIHDQAQNPMNYLVVGTGSGGGSSASNLTDNYVFGSSGTVHALRYMPHFSAYLNEFYYYTGTTQGTPTGNLVVEVREANANSITLPGTLLTSENSTPTAGNTWQQVVFTTPQFFRANQIYYIIVGNPTGNATNYWRLWQNSFNPIENSNLQTSRRYGSVSTSNGFSTSGSGLNSPIVGLMQFSNGLVIGSVHTTGGTSGNNTNKRGFLFTNLEADYEVVGSAMAATTSISGIEIFAEHQKPNDTPLYRQELNDANRNLGVVYYERPFRMRAGRGYRIVMTYSANSSSPGQINSTLRPGTWPLNPFNNHSILGAGLWGDRMFPTLQSGNNWNTGHGNLGVLSYQINFFMRRITDPRI
jgi:hypothetical protein